MRILLRESDINDPELSNSDKKILSLLHNKVFNEIYGDHTTWDDEDKEYAKNHLDNFDEDLLLGIRNFLEDILHLEENLITYYAELFFKEYIEGGDYNQQVWKQDNDLRFYELEKKYAEIKGISPIWVRNTHDTRYGLPILYDYIKQEQFMIGTEGESRKALMEYYEGSGIYDFIEWLGEEGIINHLYITHTDKRLLAHDESNYRVEDLDDIEIIDEIKDTELGDEYKELEKELDSEKDTGEIEKRMERIIQQARDVVRERIYDDVYYRLDKELEDYLWEMGYITQKNGKWVFGENLRKDSRGGLDGTHFDIDLLPNWLNVDEDDLVEHMVEEFADYEVLSDEGYYEWAKDKNGDIYYIYPTDY